MLPQFMKFVLVNNSGQTIDFDSGGGGVINLIYTGWYVTPSTGKIAYATPVEDDMGFDGTDTIVDTGEVLSSEIDNTSTLYLGMQVQLEITHDAGAAAAGTFDLYLAGGATTGSLPTDATGYGSAEAAKLQPIGSLTWDTDGGDGEMMRSNVFNI